MNILKYIDRFLINLMGLISMIVQQFHYMKMKNNEIKGFF